MSLSDKLDPKPLIQQLIEKTAAGKLNWEPTADRRTFIASLAGKMSFRIQMIPSRMSVTSGSLKLLTCHFCKCLTSRARYFGTSRPMMFRALYCKTCMSLLGALATVLTRNWNRH
jgi:hypothetical protein